ncbi:MAG: GNAT family N-acetyltransferase [Acidobacteriaceae bacterium]|nr:GNAT family N-acetyltransferase [Acidobacteriaceae bacterium]
MVNSTNTSAVPRNPSISIRTMREEDVPAVYAMLRESAIVQGGENDLCANPLNLLQDGFGAEPQFQCLLAEWHGEVIGLVLYFFLYSTWTSPKGLYIEDLYVVPQHRRQGIGRALTSELAKLAIDAGCRYIKWVVLRTNTEALRFYESMGAVTLPQWTVMRISDEELKQLAAEPSD